MLSTPVYTTLADVSSAFESVVGESPTGVTTLFETMLFIAVLLWVAWQIFASVGLYTSSNIGLLDLSIITIRTLILVVVLLVALSI